MQQSNEWRKDSPLSQNNIDSVSELLYRLHMDNCKEEPQIVRDQYAVINLLVSHLPLAQQDEIWDAVCMICTEYGRSAFRNGLHMGARLILELSV